MSFYEQALMADRMSTVQAFARREAAWAEVRRARQGQPRRGLAGLIRGIGALRLRARRSMKRNRTLA